MNSLSETKIYKNSDPILGLPKYKSLTGTLANINMDEYAVPAEFYLDYLYQFKAYRYPLAKLTFENSKEGVQNVIPIIVEEGVNREKTPSLSQYIPQSLFVFLRPVAGTLKAYVQTGLKGGYKRNKVSKEIEMYNIKPLHLYAFMQFGTVRRLVQLKDAQISKSTTLLNKLADFYSFLISKIIDSYFSISAIKDDYLILQFICNCFFLENMAKMTKEEATRTTLANRRFAKDATMLNGRCNYLAMSSEHNMFSKHSIPDEFPIDEFCRICEDQFPQMDGKFVYRSFNFQVVNRYTQNATFVLEDFNSFLIMLQSAYLKTGLFNDIMIANSLGADNLSKLFKDLELILS